MKPLITLLVGLLLINVNLNAQVKIGNNPTNVNANSILELESTTKALLLPRLNSTQIQAMQNVPAGMLVYNSTDNVLYIRTNSGWATLSQAANTASVTNPWSTTGTDIYSTNTGKVGIGTNTPFSQLANTSINTIGSQGLGGNPGSFAWANSQDGYVGQIYNGGNAGSSNGLVVKVGSSEATALDVSQGAQNEVGSPLLYVQASGKVGIGTNAPTQALDVNGNINTNGTITAQTFNVGVQYVINNSSIPDNNYGSRYASCPSGTKLIGGGGGHNAFNSAQQDITVNYSGPNPSNTNQWMLLIDNNSSSGRGIIVYAICAKVQ